MKTLATTLIATCCFALMGTQAQAIELLVRVLPGDVRESSQAAMIAARNGRMYALSIPVPTSEQGPRYAVVNYLAGVENVFLPWNSSPRKLKAIWRSSPIYRLTTRNGRS